MPVDMIFVGKTIREVRMSNRLSQSELAERVGVSIRTIIAIEKGKRQNPSFEVMDKLIEVLHIPAAVIFNQDVREKADLPLEHQIFLQEFLNMNGRDQQLVMSIVHDIWERFKES